ncbi:tetratricopeptide repeat protein [Neisseria leonii]|uniref:Ancillary SecYEG translocon subunit n=1 Tax=Neisseria leonii TaxID=2995413 RepID=A0A9X4E0E0_9NEIS|nr:tetratricopeptide repeat protein [Neisseria sp. 51.81]MDD9327142.1 tetratricopeptide repeat protein [Neisseria sp. 51.81]
MAAHIDDQQELENFKYFWKSWGRWLFAVLLLAALGYLGWVMYQKQQTAKNQEAAAVLVRLAEKAQAGQDDQSIAADLQNLQQNYPASIAAAQASMMVAAAEFDKGRYDEAAKHLSWVLDSQKNGVVQALAAQRLAVVQLQQNQFDAALATLNRPVDAAFAPWFAETKGDVLAAQDKAADAVAAYDEALAKLAQDNPARALLQMKADQLR